MDAFDFRTQFDLWQFVGITGAPQIERFVEYLKVEWKLPTYIAPLAAILAGVGFNVGLAFFLQNSVGAGAMLGLLTGFAASGWHEIVKKPPTPTIVATTEEKK
jgi:hypothetical protein